MDMYALVEKGKRAVRKHLGLSDKESFHFTVISEGVLFFRNNLLYNWNDQLQELSYDKVKELTQGLQLGDFNN